ncbi:MAG: substrate-binding domain-containing protein [Acidobacteria bacterium]|nr:substrate-binding domain-containing protein [Acidobacteriota bacterium]
MAAFRKLVSLVAVAALLGTLAGCSGGAGGHSVEEKYYFISANIKIPYWQAAGAGFDRAASQLKVKAEFVGPDRYDPKAQQEEFRRILQQKPSGILVSAADPALLRPDIDAAIAAGIPVITVDADAPKSKRLMFIGTDNYQAGRLGGQVLVKHLRLRGNVVVFTMPGQANLDERLRGYSDVLAAYPQIKIVEVVDIQGNPALAFDRAKQIIGERAKVDAFVCLEALAGKEVADVLDRNQSDKVVVAMDTDEGTLNWIKQGRIVATIAQKPGTMGYFGLKMLDDLHHHKVTPLDGNWSQNPSSPLPNFVDTGSMLIDKDNVDAFIRAREEAGK